MLLHRRPEIDEIVGAVCARFGVSQIDLASDRRNHTIIVSRFSAYFLLATLTKESLVSIGRRLGGRSYSTIARGLRTAAARICSDPKFAEQVESARRAALSSFPSRTVH